MNPTFEPTAHHPNGPSRFPMLAECIDFEPIVEDFEDLDEDEEDESPRGRGAAKHKAVAMLFSGDLESRQHALDGLNDRERREVEFVVRRVSEIIESHGYDVNNFHVEQRVTLLDGEFRILYFGTCDGKIGPLIFDWKFGLQRNYFVQLAGYALPEIEASDEPRRIGFVVYGKLQKHEQFVITRETARAVVYGLLARRASDNRRPTPCQYCNWCSKVAKCPAIVATPVALVARREDWALKLPSPHVSQLHDPLWLGAARYVWKRYLEPWGSAVEFASSMMATSGTTPVGFVMRPEKGRTSIADTRKAFEALVEVIGVDALWSAMDTSITTLAKVHASTAGIPEAKAKAIILAKLTEAGALTTGPASFKLYADRHADETLSAALRTLKTTNP